MCAYEDHNVLFNKYFAADEAQSLAAIFRFEEGAVDGEPFSLNWEATGITIDL